MVFMLNKDIHPHKHEVKLYEKITDTTNLLKVSLGTYILKLFYHYIFYQ